MRYLCRKTSARRLTLEKFSQSSYQDAPKIQHTPIKDKEKINLYFTNLTYGLFLIIIRDIGKNIDTQNNADLPLLFFVCSLKEGNNLWSGALIFHSQSYYFNQYIVGENQHIEFEMF